MERVVSSFRSVTGDEGVSVGSAVRDQHGRDESVHRWVVSAMPECHLPPNDMQQVQH